MPITQSAKKALRQNARRRARNRDRANAYKTAVKQFKKLVAANKPNETRPALAKAYQALDKAAKSGTIKKNKASRLTSRLARLTAPKA